jgi:Hemerythrin HHE cation binding domain
MTATAVRPTQLIPVPRSPGDDVVTSGPAAGRAVAYQRVLHQLVRRELRLLAELAAWAAPDDIRHTADLTRHAELVSRVLLHHHAVEREAVWPALLRVLPEDGADDVRATLDGWRDRCARIDHMLRAVATAARQWRVAGTFSARDGFAAACATVADAVDAQTAEEERTLLPLLGEHLRLGDWAAIARSSHCRLTGAEQLLVLGLALEDSCADDRARLLEGLPRSVRLAWRTYGWRHYRATVVRLRGAPPAR